MSESKHDAASALPTGKRERAAGYAQAVMLGDDELVASYEKALGRKQCLALAKANIRVFGTVIADTFGVSLQKFADENIATARDSDRVEPGPHPVHKSEFPQQVLDDLTELAELLMLSDLLRVGLPLATTTTKAAN